MVSIQIVSVAAFEKIRKKNYFITFSWWILAGSRKLIIWIKLTFLINVNTLLFGIFVNGTKLLLWKAKLFNVYLLSSFKNDPKMNPYRNMKWICFLRRNKSKGLLRWISRSISKHNWGSTRQAGTQKCC